MRSRKSSVLLVVLALISSVLFGAAIPAAATPPVSLGSSRVLDDAGVLSSSEEREIVARSEALSESSRLDLWVVYVDRFTDPSDPSEWGTQTARLNGLGLNQYVLVVSTDGRTFYLAGQAGGPVSDEQLAQIEQDRVGPALGNDGWVAGAIAAADGLAAARGGDGGVNLGVVLFVLLLAAVLGVLVWLFVRSRRRAAGAAGGSAPAVPIEELARHAASALVQTDDAVKTSEQELGFARAQFGDEAAAEFEATIAQAKADLDAAFSLQQKLDDDIPDTDDEVRAWNTRIIELCTHANTELDAKAEAFDELRKLEQNAPEALTRVQELRTEIAARVPDTTATLTGLRQEYAADALATIADNAEQITQRLAFADEQVARAEAAIGAGKGGEAAVSIRAAEEAIGQARALEDAVARMRDDLRAAESQAAALLAEIDGDLAAAAALPDVDGRVTGVVTATRQQTEAAQPLLTGAERDPLRALELLERANAQIDALLAGIRDEQERQRRAAQQLEQLLAHAQAQVSAAEDFITSRRGAVGATARTRLAEAGASIVHARQLAATDPTAALSAAQRANELAAQAIRQAQNDVGAFGSGSGNGGGNVMGAVLGGILLNSMLGGGGGGRRGGGPTMRSGGRGGGFSSGSFGGGATRTRRGGGRF
ncbi:TPM domain-containing protein [Microbacterium sp.]|uniref:TPM domain-containing protein n=1 Tax=Microbacterium sp. TaxID=51671 RepID=UPI0039E3783A